MSYLTRDEPTLLISKLEAAHRLGVSSFSIDQLVTDKRLRTVRIGNRKMIVAADLLRLIEEG